MNNAEFLNILKIAHDVPNYYNNKYPKNLGYYDGSRYSFDCWNLVKVVLSGWQPTGVKGSYVEPAKLVTGDVDGATILSKCTSRSKDFSQISIPGTYLYLASNPHAGVYIGETTINGKVYNVVECTKNSWGNGVLYTYVDKDGTRRKYKGSSSTSLKWSEYGLLTKWVTYSGNIPVNKYPQLQKGSRGDDVKKLQTLLVAKGYDPKGIDGCFGNGCERAVKQFQTDKGLPVTGIVNDATWEALINTPNAKQDVSKYPILKIGSKGKYVKLLQTTLTNKGYDPKGIDSNFGQNTDKAVRQFQKDSKLVVDGCVGPKTWDKLING